MKIGEKGFDVDKLLEKAIPPEIWKTHVVKDLIFIIRSVASYIPDPGRQKDHHGCSDYDYGNGCDVHALLLSAYTQAGRGFAQAPSRHTKASV